MNDTTFVDWDEVRKEALAQAVFLLLAKSECLPAEIAKSWRTAFRAAMRDNIEAFYAGKIVRGERKLDSAEVVRDAIERKKIYEQLHLFEV